MHFIGQISKNISWKNDKNMFIAERLLSVCFKFIIFAICAVFKMGVAKKRKLDSKRDW